MKVLQDECTKVGMKVSLKKSQAVKSHHAGMEVLSDYPLEFVLGYRYLGVKVELRTAYYMVEYSAERATKAVM